MLKFAIGRPRRLASNLNIQTTSAFLLRADFDSAFLKSYEHD